MCLTACLLLNGISALHTLLVPRKVEIKYDTCWRRFEIDKLLKNDLRLTSSTYRNNVDVDILDKYK